MNDTFIFDLELFQWHKVYLLGIDKNSILPRCGHSSAIVGNQLFIFGGISNNSYIGSSMFIINLIPDSFGGLIANILVDGEKLNKEGNKNNKINLPLI